METLFWAFGAFCGGVLSLILAFKHKGKLWEGGNTIVMKAVMGGVGLIAVGIALIINYFKK